MLLNINATRAFILCFFTILNQKNFASPQVQCLHAIFIPQMSPHDLERLRTTMVDFIVIFNMGRSVVSWTLMVGYFIPLNGPLNGHPPSIIKEKPTHFTFYQSATNNIGMKTTLSHNLMPDWCWLYTHCYTLLSQYMGCYLAGSLFGKRDGRSEGGR